MKKLVICIAVAALFAWTAPAFSASAFFILQEDARFIQTGPTSTVSDGFDFTGRASPNDGIGPLAFDSGTLSFPAASPLGTAPLSPSGVELQYASGKVDQTTFQTDFPNGTYTFHLTDSTNPAHTQTEAVDSTIVAAPTTTPLLSASSFNGLQGMDPAKAFTVTFNSFLNPSPDALSFFAIVDSGGNTVVFDGLQPSDTQDIIPANTLQSGSQYRYFLFFSNVAISADNNAEVLLSNRTQGSFATESAVPLPSAAVAGSVLLAGLVAARYRRQLPFA